MVLIYFFACLNRELLFNEDFPVNSEVMSYFIDTFFLVIDPYSC